MPAAELKSFLGFILSLIHSRYGNSCASFKPVAAGERTVEMIDPVPRNLSKVECIAFCMVGLQKKIFPEDLKFYFNQQDEFSVEDGCLLRGSRVVIPAKYQASVLSELHLNHPGTVRMKSLAGLHV